MSDKSSRPSGEICDRIILSRREVSSAGVTDLRSELNPTERKLLEAEEDPDRHPSQLGKKVKQIFKVKKPPRTKKQKAEIFLIQIEENSQKWS